MRRFSCEKAKILRSEIHEDSTEGDAKSQLFQKVEIGFCNLEKLKKREFNFCKLQKAQKNMTLILSTLKKLRKHGFHFLLA